MINFKPLSNASLETLRIAIVTSRKTQNAQVHDWLMDAVYDAFSQDYTVDGNYNAYRMTALHNTLVEMQGEDTIAITKWIVAFAPVSFDKKNDCFKVCKEKTSVLALWDIAEEADRINAFWNWAVEIGLAQVKNHWHQYATPKKEHITALYDLNMALVEVTKLCAKLTKGQYGHAATEVMRAFQVAKLEYDLQVMEDAGLVNVVEAA